MTASVQPPADNSTPKPGGDRRQGKPARHEDRAFGGHTPEEHQDDLLDEGIEETFPASDPVSVPRIRT